MKLALIAGCFFLLTSAWAQKPLAECRSEVAGRSQHWPLDLERIRHIMQQNPLLQRVDLSQGQILAPPDFTTHGQNSELELRRIQESPGRRLVFVTMRCRERTDCGSFLVEIALPSPLPHNPSASEENSSAGLMGSLGRCKRSISSVDGPVLVQPHSISSLVIEEDGLRITEPVLPQKRARLGDLVRVSDPSTHRSVMARVIGPGLLVPSGAGNQPRSGGTQ
ncbi:MAG TPA: hypothetical protein VJO35_16220 [Terriglobales bacterium]|nr:hypothetical protein [Terriglobales bacterium]